MHSGDSFAIIRGVPEPKGRPAMTAEHITIKFLRRASFGVGGVFSARLHRADGVITASVTAGPHSDDAVRRLRADTGTTADVHRPGDRITGRIFGQTITMQRCEWEALAQGDVKIRARGAEMAVRSADERAPIERDDFASTLNGGSYGGGSL